MSEGRFEFRRVSSAGEWLKIRLLYRAAFPASERKPFSRIVEMWKKEKSDVWYFSENARFAGFATTINSDSLVLIDYLAVVRRRRGQGTGTRAIESMKARYEGRALFVEIESPYEEGSDQADRVRRKRFYERCGMEPMNVMADVFGVKMELLVWNGQIDFAGYHAFYRDHYSPWAAEHITEAVHPERAR